jgi:hypothetical protein
MKLTRPTIASALAEEILREMPMHPLQAGAGAGSKADAWAGLGRIGCVLSSKIPQKNRPKIPMSPCGNILIFSAA